MLLWIASQICIILRVFIRGRFGQSHLYLFSGPLEVPAVGFGEGDISTETETRWQRRSTSARISRRLVPLARSASASVDFSGRDHSRALLEQAFDDDLYQFKMRNCWVTSHGGSSFSLFCFRPFFRGSCYHAHQCDRSPTSEFVPFCVCWGAGSNSWSDYDELVLFFLQHILFSLLRVALGSIILFSDSWFSVLFSFSRRFAVHRVRWCSESVGASGAEAIPGCSSVGRYHWHEWWWEWCWRTTAKITFEEDV